MPSILMYYGLSYYFDILYVRPISRNSVRISGNVVPVSLSFHNVAASFQGIQKGIPCAFSLLPLLTLKLN